MRPCRRGAFVGIAATATIPAAPAPAIGESVVLGQPIARLVPQSLGDRGDEGLHEGHDRHLRVEGARTLYADAEDQRGVHRQRTKPWVGHEQDLGTLPGHLAPELDCRALIPANVEDVVNNNRMRQALEGAKAAFGLFSDSVRVRNNAITELRESADESKLPLIDRALTKETDASLKAKLEQLRESLRFFVVFFEGVPAIVVSLP